MPPIRLILPSSVRLSRRMDHDAPSGGNGARCPTTRIVVPRAATAEPEVYQEERTATAADVPWNVVVHNDPITKMNYVTMVFRKVFGYSKEKSEVHMMEVHQKGRSIVWSGARERGELYVQQLHGYQLLATLEKSQ